MNRAERREWRRHVFGRADLTAAHKLVLLALETFADYPVGTNARPGMARLAEMCGLGNRVVDGALHHGRRLGLIEQTARANPKAGRAAVYRLVSTRTSVHVETDFNPHEPTFQPAQNDVSTRTSVRPTNPDQSISTEARERATQPAPISIPEEEPPRYCPAHMPNGTRRDCGACGTARENNKGWKEQQAERRRLQELAKRQAIADCNLCEGTGSIWVNDDTVTRCECNPHEGAA
jgi:hypothetical protein